jgi:hypothetical protein
MQAAIFDDDSLGAKYKWAFGVFTGFKPVKPESGDKNLGIVNENVVEINSSST